MPVLTLLYWKSCYLDSERRKEAIFTRVDLSINRNWCSEVVDREPICSVRVVVVMILLLLK